MRDAVAGVIHGEHGYLLTQRDALGSKALMWHFPGGKVEPGETHHEALTRELYEEIRVVAVVAKDPIIFSGSYGKPRETSHQTAYFLLQPSGRSLLHFCAEITFGKPIPKDGTIGLGWFTIEEALRLNITPATQTILHALANGA